MIRISILTAMLTLGAYAQTSNVERVKSWTRDPVMADLQTGEIRDTSGMIADGQRMAAMEAGLDACTNLVLAANTGLSNALVRLYAETNRVSAFEGRIYIAADMDVAEGNSNIWFTTGREWLDQDLAVHYWVNCSHEISVFPETIYDFWVSPTEVIYGAGEAQNSGQPVTNINGITYYHVKVPRPQGVGNVVIRTNKHLKMGHSSKPLNLASAGMTLNGAALYTGTIAETSGARVVTRTYSQGALKSRTETTGE